MPNKPQIVYRKAKVLQDFIPVGKTVLDELIKAGKLKVVHLTPERRAVAITQASVIDYQQEIMGLQPLADDAPEPAPLTVERRNT